MKGLKRRLELLEGALVARPDPNRLIVWDESRMNDQERAAFHTATDIYARLTVEIPGDMRIPDRLMLAAYDDRLAFLKALRALRPYINRAPRVSGEAR